MLDEVFKRISTITIGESTDIFCGPGLWPFCLLEDVPIDNSIDVTISTGDSEVYPPAESDPLRGPTS